MFKKVYRIFGEVRIWIKFLLIVRRPDDTPKIFEMIDLIVHYRGIEYFDFLQKRCYVQCPELKKQFDDEYVPRFPTEKELQNLPPTSLGRRLLEDLKQKGLDLNFFPLLDHRHPVKYLFYRAYLVHDISHMVLGYNTSLEDELALQAYTVAQTNAPISTMLVAGGLINIATTNPAGIFSALQKISAAFTRGQKHPQMLAFEFDKFLHLSVEQVRSQALFLDV